MNIHCQARDGCSTTSQSWQCSFDQVGLMVIIIMEMVMFIKFRCVSISVTKITSLPSAKARKMRKLSKNIVCGEKWQLWWLTNISCGICILYKFRIRYYHYHIYRMYIKYTSYVYNNDNILFTNVRYADNISWPARCGMVATVAARARTIMVNSYLWRCIRPTQRQRQDQ